MKIIHIGVLSLVVLFMSSCENRDSWRAGFFNKSQSTVDIYRNDQLQFSLTVGIEQQWFDVEAEDVLVVRSHSSGKILSTYAVIQHPQAVSHLTVEAVISDEGVSWSVDVIKNNDGNSSDPFNHSNTNLFAKR